MATSTIGSDARWDYATPQLWEDTLSNPTEDQTGYCQQDEAYGPGLLLFRHSNTNDVDIIVEVLPAARHNYQAGNGARQTKGAGDANPAIYIDAKNVKLKNFAGHTTGDTPYGAIGLVANVYTITGFEATNCLFSKGSTNLACLWYGGGTAGSTPTFNACAFIADGGSHAVDAVESNDTTELIFNNCVFLGIGASGLAFNSSMGSGTDVGIQVNNCKVMGGFTTGLFNGSGTYSGTNNVISEASPPSGVTTLGGGYGVSQSASDHFTSVTSGSPDVSIKSSLNKANYIGGNELAGGTDVEGDNWVTDYCDTGCDAESVVAAAGAPPCAAGLRLGMRSGL